MNANHAGVGSWIERWARVRGDRLAIVHGETHRTYAELAGRVRRLAQALRRLGVKQGDRIAWMGPNHPAFLEVFFAAAKLGAAVAPVNERLDRPVLDLLFHDIQPRVSLVHQWRPASAGLHQSWRPASAGPQESPIDVSDDSRCGYERILAASRDEAIDDEVSSDALILLPFTSGTTGVPKGVMLTQANVTWNAINAVAAFDLREDDITIALPPFHRTGGTGALVLPVLFRGGTVVIPQTTSPDDLLQVIEREKVTVAFTNPDLLEGMRRSTQWQHADLSSLRLLVAGGTMVPERLLRCWRERGIDVRQGYGLSEAAPLVSVMDAASASTRLASSGRPVLFVDTQVVAPDGAALAAGQVGELRVRGPNVMAGYWRQPDETRRTFAEDGWLKTGDAAYRDEDGRLFIAGRMADAYESGGEVIHPGFSERVLMQHPAVEAASVIGGPEGAVAYIVVAATAAHATTSELSEWCGRHLSAAARPRAIRIVDSLPKNSNGKVRRDLLAKSLEFA